MSYTKITLHPDRELWERQPRETATAYARFIAFRDLRPSERSYARVAEISGKAVRTTEQLGSSHRWLERAAAWDTHQAAQRAQRLNEQEEEMGRAVMQAARAATAVVLSSIRTINDSGEPLEAKDIPRWAEAIERMRRIALDRPEHVIEIGHHAETTTPTEDLDALTPEQRRARIREMSEHLVRAVTDRSA